MKNEDINWVTPEEIVGNNDSVIDRYVLLDDSYVLTKKAILDCFSTRSPHPLKELLEQKKTTEPYLCLGLYQNVTILAKNMSDSMLNLASIFEPWLRSTFPNETKIFAPLLNNSFSNLFQVNDENWRDIDLTVLLVQLKYSILFSKLSIIEPLRKILTQPMLIQNCYLPTMPQDNLFDIKIALQSRSSTNKFYSCPNGHIYVIGDCGRPWIMDKCKTCGEAIGGEQHRLVSDNSMIDDSIHDKTMKGYCIQNLCNRAENMRSLNMTGFFYQRFLIDACMYLALGDEGQNKDQVMSGMCHKENDLGAFFLIRIKNDLALLASELNLNMDEIYLLLHLSVKKFLSYKSETKEFSFDTKAKRQDWEENFYEMFFANILENLNKELSESNRKIREKNQEFSSKENSQSALYFMAYELIPMMTSKENYLYENELFWKYRPSISFDLISKEFAKVQQNKNNYAILSKFIEINFQLELLVNLGLIMQMVNLFKSEHNKNISKSKARAESLGEYLSSISVPKGWSLEKIKLCVNAYQNTWLFIQPKISEYMLKNFPKQNLSVQFQHSFDMTTKLSYFLPTLSGDGFLSYLMIHYMAKIQNEMLEQCKKKLSHIPTKSAQLFDDQSQLITFDKQSDLLRVLQSNFSYKSTELKFVFRYESIENQIMDKYMRSKAQIDLNSIPIFEYSDEISYFRTFKLLNEQVVQQSLRLSEMAQIMDDFKNISEISEALNTLRIIIDYTIVTSLDPNDSLVDFLKKIYSGSLLKQTEAILKAKILEYGRLKNLKVIWILLITKKSILSTISGQDPFESLDDRFKIETMLKLDLNMDKASLISLTVILYQIIDFFLSTKIGDDINIYSIKDMFDSLESLDGVIMLENFVFPAKLNNQISQEIKMDKININITGLCPFRKNGYRGCHIGIFIFCISENIIVVPDELEFLFQVTKKIKLKKRDKQND
ncbi:E3 ubiquitin-ligase RNF213-like [Brachionus plicatilis]|uniref:E3 ubiquitin-ligase RNF213-like n=1 Tax=Brachionus plicatilis TaxID=10195 RepID=A0A3M7P338_BRAPC|nr:E3 ubiquitin-ligase RNF213-like [Brachionus plicatilis]